MVIKKDFKLLTSKERSIELNIKPKAREELVKNHFECKGFKVVKLEEHYFFEGQHKGMTLQIDKIKELKNSKKVFKAISIINKLDKGKIPDFVCEKGKLLIFVEVKGPGFNPNNRNQIFLQRESLLELKNKGYEVEIWCCDIDKMLINFEKIQKNNLKENQKLSKEERFFHKYILKN